MLDHVFTDAIGALRDAIEAALLERQAFEERFQSDILLGDLSWETSYSLPGEGAPARVKADVTLLWSTWSQTAYRDWYLGDTPTDPPHIDIGITMRIQRLAESPDPSVVIRVLPRESSSIGPHSLVRSGPTIETVYGHDLGDAEYAIEVSYEGSYELDENTLDDGKNLDEHFASMGGWITSTLVRLGDLALVYRPADDPLVD